MRDLKKLIPKIQSMFNSPSVGTTISSLGTNLPIARELARSEYTPYSSHYAFNKLDNAFDQRLSDIKPGAQHGYHVAENYPVGDTFIDRLNHVSTADNTNKFASSSTNQNPSGISINPKASREIYAHELGHILSQQTDIGRAVAALRANPKLAKVLGTSAIGLGAGTVATLNDGNNEYDEAALIGLASTIPTLADEALATGQGLTIMNKAGMRPTPGQYGRLATGLMSYAAPAVVAALIGTSAGNVLEYAGDQMTG